MESMSGRTPTSGQRVANPSVPIGLRVYASCSQGGRKYMEDNYDLKYQLNADNELQYIYLAIFDGHGGDVAAKYAKQHLCNNIIRQRAFWSKTNDDDVLQAIRKGFVRTHYDMRKEVPNWPKTASGLPSTSGTTASIVFIMNGKYYTGHVGDSRIVLGRKHEASGKWMSCSLTRDHKPESPRERRRIEAAGGQVMNKSGVDRVVWNRPKLGHKGPIRRSTSFDQIPFLAVARSLGDLWSFNSENNTFIVSPEPDVKCIPIDGNDMCLVLASDGLWNMMTTQTAVRVIQEVEEDQYSPELLEAVFGTGSNRLSPSRALVHFCLNRWYQSRFRADNTTVLSVMIEDNQGIQLVRNDQNVPMSSLFSDSEEEDSDDGYYETFDTSDYVFSQTYDCLRNNLNTNSNTNTNIEQNNNKSDVNSTEISSTTTFFSSSETTTVPENQKPFSTSSTSTSSCSSAELSSDNSNTSFIHEVIEESNRTTAETNTVLTPLTNVSPNFSDNSQPIGQTFEPIDDNSSQSSESSRDSGTASPPTPLAITVGEELTEDEYASLPSLVNLSTNESDLFVLFDPKSLSVLSTDFNGVPIGEENSCFVDECQSSLANINKVIEDNSPLNNYMYGRSSSYLRQTPNPTDFLMTTNDNFWSENSFNYSLTALRPRTSLPLNFMENHFTNKESDQCSPLISLKERTSAALNDNSLCIFGALSSSSVIQSSGSSESCVKKFTKVLSNSSGIHNIRTKGSASTDSKGNRLVIKHSRLLRSLGNNGSKVQKMSVHRLSKRKYSPDYSPPSKHLRSSLWTRPLVSKEHIMRMSFTRSLKQLAVGRLTRSRLRPIKLLKTFNKK